MLYLCTVEGDTTDTEGTGAEGGNLGYNLGDFYSDWFKGLGKGASTIYSAASQVNKYNPFVNDATRKVSSKGSNDVSEFVENELTNKSDLRSSQLLSMASGLPLIGPLISGIQGAFQLEDLYNRTGKTSAYPGLQGAAGGVGAAAGQGMRMLDGQNDLYRYYAGEPDQWTINMYG